MSKPIFMEEFTRLADVVFNNRPATPPNCEKSKVTIAELIRRGDSIVRVDGVLYEVSVKRVVIE